MKIKGSIILLTLVSFLICVSFVMLTKNNKNQLVDLEKEENTISDLIDNMNTDGFIFDQRPNSAMHMGYSIGKEYLYDMVRTDRVKLNLFTGRTKPFCDIPGCSHSEISVGCKQNLGYNSLLPYKDKLYFIRGNSLYIHEGEKEEIVFTNEYHTEYEIENHPDRLNNLICLTACKEGIVVCGYSFFIIYNPETGSISNPVGINVENDNFWGFASGDKAVYYYNGLGELYSESFDGTKTEKIMDGVTAAYCEKDEVFFCTQGVGLYKLDSSGKPRKILEECYVNFCPVDGKIFFQKWKTSPNIFVADYEGNELAEIEVGQYEFNSDIFSIIGADGISKVYCINRDNSSEEAVLVIDADTYESTILHI